ncbi:hypothetical protein [Paenibacillus sp. ACRRY]|uniref:hypothetical protein n=1 Tax=Paenibacillus sp. ACRRY TaxID=2918208 RepID=UPI001EF4636D|nr:hypothetical protein [Paenibacillus sp. ACRRY]MCG7383336.1 hypothetical protein [Paenibacillus sp. ACRRY]
MDDYRGKIVKVDGRKMFACIGQEFYTRKLYLRLPKELEHLDCDRCSEPTFEIDARRCSIVDPEDIATSVVDYVMSYEGGAV